MFTACSRAHIDVGLLVRTKAAAGLSRAGGGLGASWCGAAGVNSASCAIQTVRAAIHGGGGARGVESVETC